MCKIQEIIKMKSTQEIIDILREFKRTAGEKYEPSIVTRQIVDIAQAFNKFYFEHNIKDAAPAVKNARLALVGATKQVIESGLALLGIAAPQRM